MIQTIPTKLSHIVEIPKISNDGHLCFAEAKKNIPFPIKRFYYIYDVGRNATRGRHAHKQTLQVLFCIKGKIKIILDNGNEQEEVVLDKSHQGIFLDKMMWHEMTEFGEDTLLLVLASDYYNESDYIRDYDLFIQRVNNPLLRYPQIAEWIEDYKRISSWVVQILNKKITLRI